MLRELTSCDKGTVIFIVTICGFFIMLLQFDMIYCIDLLTLSSSGFIVYVHVLSFKRLIITQKLRYRIAEHKEWNSDH